MIASNCMTATGTMKPEIQIKILLEQVRMLRDVNHRVFQAGVCGVLESVIQFQFNM